ncbi:MAG: twin-arginine translocase subunit TatC, partial [Rudaea sp.]
MPDILSILLLSFVALILIGPRRLPQSVEALWLAVTDYGRVQRGLPPLGSIENARIVWSREKNSVYAFVQILYQVTVHLEELRSRLLISIAVLAVTFLVAFFFSQQLLALVVKPISGAPFKPASEAAVNEYVLARDIRLSVTIPSEKGPTTSTVTIPAGTEIPLTLPSPKPVFLHPTELFATYIKISGMAAVGLSLPVLLWEVLMFLRGPKLEMARLSRRQWEEKKKSLSPEALKAAEEERAAVYGGLTASEVRPMYVLVPLAGVFFLAGVLFTYFLILPQALEFLFGLGGNLVQPLPSLDDYIGFSIA